jgi:hypothetical protein
VTQGGGWQNVPRDNARPDLNAATVPQGLHDVRQHAGLDGVGSLVGGVQPQQISTQLGAGWKHNMPVGHSAAHVRSEGLLELNVLTAVLLREPLPHGGGDVGACLELFRQGVEVVDGCRRSTALGSSSRCLLLRLQPFCYSVEGNRLQRDGAYQLP